MAEGQQSRFGRRLKQAKLAAVLLAVGLVLIVFFQNNQREAFSILFWQVALPRSVLLLVAFVAGAGAGLLAGHLMGRRR